MNKERLEWVISGLNRYALTKSEDQFVKTACEDFAEKNALTARQEERFETLYKEKSKLVPNKKSSDYFSFKESSPQKGRPRRPHAKMVV
jgi:hypothetical protein